MAWRDDAKEAAFCRENGWYSVIITPRAIIRAGRFFYKRKKEKEYATKVGCVEK